MSRWLILVFVMFFSSGCASIVSKTDSTTYIQTEPENARCELHGQDFVRVVNTPDSIMLPSEASPVTVACTAEGYKNTTQVVEGHYDGWIWGNILLGGIVGAAIDGARGAGKVFPPRVLVVLEPEFFADEEERDAFYDYKAALITEEWSPVLEKAERKCDRKEKPESTFCRKADSLKEERDAKLAELEQKRALAKIEPPEPVASEPVEPAEPGPEPSAEPATEPVETSQAWS